MGPLRRNSQFASAGNSALTRSSSVSTEMYVRAESPYRGPSGPSHPYGMYPQESRLARTASIATTSTVQVPDRPYNGPGGPTHPYGMYPQNTVPEAEVLHSSIPAVPIVPVGFPGSNNNYQRRLGPDGEEIADLIGPDGHTEQLPPYTQYPDEAFARKTRPNVAPIAGAGGIGLATRNPEFASSEDLSSPQSRMSTRSISSDASNHQVNMGALGISEKPRLKKWQQVARKRICDIVPVWVIVLVVVVFVLFGVILGTVLAILRPKHQQPKHHPIGSDPDSQSAIASTMTTTFDASPLTASPSSLPTLPTGTYALPISVPSTAANTCLDTAQSPAWACNVPPSSYTITITSLPGTSDLHNNEIDLNLGNSSFGGFYPYGTLPPVLSSTQVMNLVIDSQDPDRGPAWFFELPYNKIVIVPEAALSPSGSQKRENDERDHTVSDFMRKQVAQPGDQPWFCYWNGTLLEAFIYVNDTSIAGAYTTSTTSTSLPTKTSGSTASPTFSSSSADSSMPVWLPAYPKVMKIEERRVPGDQSITPYCIQQNIDAYGVATPLLNSTGLPVTIYLNETQASSVSQIQEKRSAEVSIHERGSELFERQSSGYCGCVWLWT